MLTTLMQPEKPEPMESTPDFSRMIDFLYSFFKVSKA
jgi:hypothetical protein